ncbi:glycine cleavage system protein GcvH [Nakamurella deserti]|uniref:glycine cleavage system protein GcvH n=1 Tax=Nakamurella deserti TaxID=2164074 RepID=UPI000DBE28B8|nr:glycine cleavage system protein GcvH [Nakamurella deserti]
MIPEDLGYSDQHEWVRSGEDVVRIGITDYAQNALGDIVFVQLPEVGSVVTSGDAIGEVESTKSVSEIFTPLTGTVVSVNDTLEASPELVNTDPYGDGWIYELEVEDPATVADLLDADAYAEIIGDA